MAGAWLRELLPVAWKGLREGLKRLKASKRQARTPLKTDGWGVAARIVASCVEKAYERVWSVWGRANGRLETLLKPDGWGVAARVGASMLAGEFEAFERQQTAGSNAL